MTYTVMRTGNLKAGTSGGGLKIGDVKEPICDDVRGARVARHTVRIVFTRLAAEQVSKEDVFRILTEAISLDSASGRMFSLCSSEDASQFKAMRMAGCDRREEADALLSGCAHAHAVAPTRSLGPLRPC